MKKSIKKGLVVAAACLTLSLSAVAVGGAVEKAQAEPMAITQLSTVAEILRQGSKGSDVKEVQRRLKLWGYYNGSVDGVFGAGTRAAVISFQKKGSLCTGPLKGCIRVFQLLCNLKSNSLYHCNGGGMLPRNI